MDDSIASSSATEAPPRTLENCEQLFSLDDFIMEPSVGAVLADYYRLGGNADHANEMLTDSYRGIGAMSTLVGGWLATLGDDEEEAAAAASGASPADAAATAAVARCYERTAAAMVVKVFNPDSADRIFESDSTDGIDWLPELIAHQPWRKLIYELSEQFPQCLMLNFAVKLISDAGFQHEISNVSTAAQQLDIFSRVFLAGVDKLLRAFHRGEHTQPFTQALSELVRVACHSEHTYLYAQSVLHVMAQKNAGKNAAACVYIAQALRASVIQRRSESSLLLVGLLQSEHGEILQNVIHALLTMISKQSLNPADVNQLYQAYSDTQPPPVGLIRDSLFTDILVNSLFNASAPKVNAEYRPMYIYLLAYAACVGERLANGERQQVKAELDATCEHIAELLALLHTTDDLAAALPRLLELIRTPVLAMGTLQFVKSTILREDFMTEPQQSHLILIDQIVSLHPHMRNAVFSMLCTLYENQSSRDELSEVIMSRQRVVVDRFVNLLSAGFVLPVLEHVIRMYTEGRIDISLVRFFGVEVLDIVDAPYSDDFVAWMLPLVSKAELFDAKTLAKHTRVATFIEQAACR